DLSIDCGGKLGNTGRMLQAIALAYQQTLHCHSGRCGGAPLLKLRLLLAIRTRRCLCPKRRKGCTGQHLLDDHYAFDSKGVGGNALTAMPGSLQLIGRDALNNKPSYRNSYDDLVAEGYPEYYSPHCLAQTIAHEALHKVFATTTMSEAYGG